MENPSARFFPGENTNTVDGRNPKQPPNMYETLVNNGIFSLQTWGLPRQPGGNNDYSNCRGDFSFYLSRLPPRLIYHINRCRISSINSIIPKNGPKTKKTEAIYRICILLVPSPNQHIETSKIQISRTCFFVLVLNEIKKLHPRRLTSPLKSYLPSRKVGFQPSFFRVNVKLREGTFLIAGASPVAHLGIPMTIGGKLPPLGQEGLGVGHLELILEAETRTCWELVMLGIPFSLHIREFLFGKTGLSIYFFVFFGWM